jgi:hypothetical protein
MPHRQGMARTGHAQRLVIGHTMLPRDMRPERFRKRVTFTVTVDLDPVPGVEWSQVREVALVTRDVMADHGLVGWPKTSGSRGIHVNVRIERRWTFDEVRRAALALGPARPGAPGRALLRPRINRKHNHFTNPSLCQMASVRHIASKM